MAGSIRIPSAFNGLYGFTPSHVWVPLVPGGEIMPQGTSGPMARSLAVPAVMVLLLGTDLVPPAIAGVGAACVLVLLRVVGVEQASRSIGWTTVVRSSTSRSRERSTDTRPSMPNTVSGCGSWMRSTSCRTTSG